MSALIAGEPGGAAKNNARLVLTGALLVFLGSQSLRADCPDVVAPCHRLVADHNCDGQDFAHCTIYDLDGPQFGDCAPDGFADDFWTFFDGDFDGTVDCQNPFDLLLMAPDGAPDGTFSHPACDKFGQDLPHTETLLFVSTHTFVIFPSGADVARGFVDELAIGYDSVFLGNAICLAEDDTTQLITDPEIPPPGRAFFYVGRWESFLFTGPTTYGFGECLERSAPPWAADCDP